MGEELKGILSIIFILALFIGILVLAYYTTKLVGRKFTIGGAAGGQIKVLDRVPIGQDRALMIVQAAGRTLLVGVASHAIATLCELDPEKLAEVPPAADAPFMAVFRDILKNRGANGPEQRKGTDGEGQ